MRQFRVADRTYKGRGLTEAEWRLEKLTDLGARADITLANRTVPASAPPSLICLSNTCLFRKGNMLEK